MTPSSRIRPVRVEGKSDIYLVQDADPAARDRDDLIRKQVDVDALDPVRLHIAEAEPREVAGAS